MEGPHQLDLSFLDHGDFEDQNGEEVSEQDPADPQYEENEDFEQSEVSSEWFR